MNPMIRSKTNAPGDDVRSGTSAEGEASPGPVAQVIAVSDLEQGRSSGVDGGQAGPLVDALTNSQHPLRRVKARLTVSVGSAEITLGELLGAREQHVLKLDRMVDQPVDVLLEGQVVARGTLVAVDEHFAVRITELPTGFDGVPAAR